MAGPGQNFFLGLLPPPLPPPQKKVKQSNFTLFYSTFGPPKARGKLPQLPPTPLGGPDHNIKFIRLDLSADKLSNNCTNIVCKIWSGLYHLFDLFILGIFIGQSGVVSPKYHALAWMVSLKPEES